MRLALLLFLLLLASPPAAAQDRVSILLGAWHAGAEGQFESFTPGVFYTWERQPWGMSLGLFRNSYSGNSVAVIATHDVAAWSGGAASLMAGVAHYPGVGHRQRYHFGDLVPLAGLQLRHGHGFMQVMPSDGRPVRAIIAFGLTWDVD